MLTDSEIVRLRKLKEYKSVTRSGLKQALTDLIQSSHDKLKPEVSILGKIISSFFRTRLIKKELHDSSGELIERILNVGLKPYNRTTKVVQDVCDQNSYKWMRFDEPRVHALFAQCCHLITDAGFRELVKSYSSIREDKDKRLLEISGAIKILEGDTIVSIQTKWLHSKLFDTAKDVYYRAHGEKIEKKMKDCLEGGALGLLPKVLGGGKDKELEESTKPGEENNA